MGRPSPWNVRSAPALPCATGTTWSTPGPPRRFVRCEVTPAGDSTAVFAQRETSYEGAEALEAGAGWRLSVQVEAGATDVVSEPMVGCGQVS